MGTWIQTEEAMKCIICKQGETKAGKATVTFERGSAVMVFKSVPAEVCSNCGEEYVDESTTAKLLSAAEEAMKTGVQVDVREYIAA